MNFCFQDETKAVPNSKIVNTFRFPKKKKRKKEKERYLPNDQHAMPNHSYQTSDDQTPN